MELIPGEKVSNPHRVCKTLLTHATSPKVFFEYHCPLLRRNESLTGRASFTSNSVYLYLYLYPTLTPQQSERAAAVYMYIPTSSSLALSLSNHSCQTTLLGCERGECFPIAPREEYSTENRTQLPSLFRKLKCFQVYYILSNSFFTVEYT